MPRTARIEKEGQYLVAIEEVESRFRMLREGLVALRGPSFANYDPIVSIAEIATDPELPASLRLRANESVAAYIYPTVRSLELANPAKQQVTIKVELAQYARKEQAVETVSFRVEEDDADDATSRNAGDSNVRVQIKVGDVEFRRPKTNLNDLISGK